MVGSSAISCMLPLRLPWQDHIALQLGYYTGTLKISLWKSGTIALTVCAVFACINSLSRAISVMIALHMQLPQDEPWFCLAACVFYNVVCWILVLTAFYPSTHAVRVMVEDDNFAQTWYVFWVFAAGVHFFEPFYDSALSDDT